MRMAREDLKFRNKEESGLFCREALRLQRGEVMAFPKTLKEAGILPGFADNALLDVKLK